MALKDAPVVEVLKFDEADAYDHDRPISSLIRTQLIHLHHAEHLVVPPRARTNININNLLTELQASEYIEKVTALLHKHGKGEARASSEKKRKKPQRKSKKRVSVSNSKKATKSSPKRRSHR